MAIEYRLIAGFDGVQRTSDDAYIPDDPGDADWREYQGWLSEGNKPEPTPPHPRPEPQPLEPVRVADPVNDTDAVNLRTLNERLEELETTILRRAKP